ncbi:ABC transporter ATP-binding protein/permease [Clostridium sporogenes]|uniref:ABC transporter ATP-binding protein/permease n=1 Tax=Clostridium sporogenes TaxID=1509 RepID=UPI003F9385E6
MINLNNITKKYGENNIYTNTNYTFKNNTLTCFLGPSGSGKTTLLNLLAGFDRDYLGNIDLQSNNLKNLSLDELCTYRFNNVGFIFQHYNLLKGYSCIENVIMGLHLNSNLSNDKKNKKALDLLTDLGLANKAYDPIDNLSGGQKQRVAIARALINDPEILLADEPTGALDEDTTKSIMEIIKKLSKNKTIVVITHDDEVAKYGDEIIFLQDNSIKVLKEKKENIKSNNSFNKKNITPKLSSNNAWKLSIKNFKIHFFKFFIAACLIAFGSAAFICSLGSKKIINNAITEFKDKNSFYNKASVSAGNKGLNPTLNKDNKKFDKDLASVFKELKAMDSIENIYYQYDLSDVSINYGKEQKKIASKSPTIVDSNLSMIYGYMPKDNRNEIALSNSVASKLNPKIHELVGKYVDFEYINKARKKETIKLKVSGISNDTFDNFTLSSNVEKKIYKYTDTKQASAISFNIKDFNKIPSIAKLLKDKKINITTKEKEVTAFKNSFENTLKLFSMLSGLILIVSILIGFTIIYKISIDRYTEIGILASLGYTKKNIHKIFSKENLQFGIISTGLSILLSILFNFAYYKQFGYKLNLSINLYLILIVLNMSLTLGITWIINIKLINTETIVALKGNN